jgi:hypothetical protein
MIFAPSGYLQIYARLMSCYPTVTASRPVYTDIGKGAIPYVMIIRKWSNRWLLILLFALIVCLNATSVSAQKQQKLATTPRSFQTFYAKFKTAVLRNDKRAVASMTSFPFSYGWDAGDEGTYTRSQFIAKFTRIFRGARGLFSRSDPTFDVDGNSVGLTNSANASHFTFEKKGSTYFFKSFIVEP